MERRAIAIQGTVQGVGFRPFVYALAARLDLRGFVRNESGGVRIEVEGQAKSLDCFLTQIATRPPPLAQIDDVSWERRAPLGDRGFRIEGSEAGAASPVTISPDVATCEDCLAELFDPLDRRHRHPFLNCTNCGPRLTVVTGAPYDRERTTMAAFAMCAPCRAEYEDPRNRRFHAQPTACPDCGPRLRLLDEKGARVGAADPLAGFVEALLLGKIGALKGLGGYHLVCDARNGAAVGELRRRKRRDEKPFAVMVRDLEGACRLCILEPQEREALGSPERPIVLLRRREDAPPLAGEVAPGNPFLGVLLPYTPLHHLLLEAVQGVPLVMTSGNRSDEPIAFRDLDALERLSGIADLFLIHDRPIHVRSDDSVVRVAGGQEVLLRRSRGFAPRPIPLSFTCPAPLLAMGGQSRSAFALGRDRQAILSHHLGDLDHLEAFRQYREDALLYRRLFAHQPALIAHDLHPDYASTRHGLELAAAEGLPSLAVQHHHAHLASCLAERRLAGPAIGVVFDGTGLGTDGAIWGGEFLVGDCRAFRRSAHLRYVGMPGGEQAIREPWRMALAHLVDAGEPARVLEARLPARTLGTVRRMLEQNLFCPPTSSVGRLFDAMASLAGVRDRVSHEGQAATQLEWLATGIPLAGAYPFEVVEAGEGEGPESSLLVDTRPLIRAAAVDVSRGTSAAVVARRFHSTLVEVIARVCCRIRRDTGLWDVVLSGGVFMNAILSAEAHARLKAEGFRPHRHRLVPPNDGGLSLGQLAVAAANHGNRMEGARG